MSKLKSFFGGGSDKSAQRAAEEARQREAQRQARLSQGRTAIDEAYAGFDDNFYDTRAQSYLDYATPQLDDQYAQAKKDLIFALSRGGKLNSSVAADRTRELNELLERNRETVNAQAQQYRQDAQRDVASSRSDLLSILNATEDPAAVREEAIRRADLNSQPPAFSPLGQLFVNIAQGLDRSSNTISNDFSGITGAKLFQGSGGSGSGRIVS